MLTLDSKADKIKKFGFVPSDVVMLCCVYTDLFKLIDEHDTKELIDAAKQVGLIDDLTLIVTAMESHPEEDSSSKNLTKFFNIVTHRGSVNIKQKVIAHLFFVPEEVVISAQKFDTTSHKVHMHIEMKLFHRDVVKLSDDFLNRCSVIIIDTDMGEVPIYSSEP
jgi:hypothetical protein